MELSKADAYLVLRTAYRSGLLQKILKDQPNDRFHVPGTSFKEETTAKLSSLNFDMLNDIAEFLALLIDTIRKEGGQHD